MVEISSIHESAACQLDVGHVKNLVYTRNSWDDLRINLSYAFQTHYLIEVLLLGQKDYIQEERVEFLGGTEWELVWYEVANSLHDCTFKFIIDMEKESSHFLYGKHLLR